MTATYEGIELDMMGAGLCVKTQLCPMHRESRWILNRMKQRGMHRQGTDVQIPLFRMQLGSNTRGDPDWRWGAAWSNAHKKVTFSSSPLVRHLLIKLDRHPILCVQNRCGLEHTDLSHPF